jgi:hypothetical protein
MSAPKKNREDLKEALSTLNSLVENEFKCPLCCDTYTDPHIIPECLHRFCGTCAKKEIAGNGGECPTCGSRLTEKRGLTRDKELQIMISMVLEAVQDVNIELEGKKCSATTETQIKIEQYSDSSVDEGGAPLLKVRVLVDKTGLIPLLKAVDYQNDDSDSESFGSTTEAIVRVKTEDSNSSMEANARVKIEQDANSSSMTEPVRPKRSRTR